MATKATAAAAFHVMAFQAPEGKSLMKPCVYKSRRFGDVCVSGKIFSSSLLTAENTEAVTASLLMLCPGDKKHDKASKGQRHAPLLPKKVSFN